MAARKHGLEYATVNGGLFLGMEFLFNSYLSSFEIIEVTDPNQSFISVDFEVLVDHWYHDFFVFGCNDGQDSVGGGFYEFGDAGQAGSGFCIDHLIFFQFKKVKFVRTGQRGAFHAEPAAFDAGGDVGDGVDHDSGAALGGESDLYDLDREQLSGGIESVLCGGEHLLLGAPGGRRLEYICGEGRRQSAQTVAAGGNTQPTRGPLAGDSRDGQQFSVFQSIISR